MAIDRKATQALLKDIDTLTQQFEAKLPRRFQGELQRLVMGPALEELRRFIIEGRPPRLFFMGRAGHGKSSLINALAGKEVAATHVVRPQTSKSERYSVRFEERYASWDVIDSRGIFDPTPPEGAEEKDALAQLRKDLLEYRPDLILHVISAPEVRAMSPDLLATRTLFSGLKKDLKPFPCLAAVVSKVDTLGDPAVWPPEDSPKGGHILEVMEYLSDQVLKAEKKGALDPANHLKGYVLEDDEYRGVIPVRSLFSKTWNLEALIEFCGNHLPDETQLDFAQGLGRKEQMVKLADSITWRFASIAGGIGAIPIPVADIVLLAPLQLLLIGIIGGLSCQPFSQETIQKYLSSAGLAVGGGIALRYAAQELIKVVPVAGEVVSGAIAYSGTLAIGKAASAYFFHGEETHPQSIFAEAQKWWGTWRSKTE